MFFGLRKDILHSQVDSYIFVSMSLISDYNSYPDKIESLFFLLEILELALQREGVNVGLESWKEPAAEDDPWFGTDYVEHLVWGVEKNSKSGKMRFLYRLHDHSLPGGETNWLKECPLIETDKKIRLRMVRHIPKFTAKLNTSMEVCQSLSRN